MKYITLTFAVTVEGEYYVARCIELGMSSFGRDEEEAVAQVTDATMLYLNTLEDLGECDDTLRQKGIHAHEINVPEVRKVECPPHTTILSGVFPLPAYA